MKILITGGTGFIGSHLIDALLKKGHQIIVIDNIKKQNRKNVKFYKIDICSPKIDLIFKKERPDIIYHLAAYIFIETNPSPNSIFAIIKNNIYGSINIIEASCKYKIKKIIFSSSIVVYGPQKITVLSENSPTNPTSFYGISKLAVEQLLNVYYRIYKLPYIVLRCANTYGPGQKLTTKTAIVNFINKLLNDEQPVINGTGEQTIDFIYIDDVVRANMAALNTNKVGIYNVGTSGSISLNKLFFKINGILNKNICPKYNQSTIKTPQKYFFNIKKIKKELKWKPKVNINTGLQKTISYFKKEKAVKIYKY